MAEPQQEQTLWISESMPRQTVNSDARRARAVAFCGTRGLPARYGGFETAVDEISRRFVAAGHSCDVVCRTPLGRPRPSEHEGRSLVHVTGSSSRKLDTFVSSVQTGCYLWRNRRRYSHVYWFNNANLPGILMTALARIPMTVNIDGIEWRRAKWSLPFKLYYYVSSCLVSLVCESLVSDSRGVQALYRRRFFKRTSYVPYGVTPTPAVSEEQQKDILESLGLKAGGYFLQITRFEPDNLPLEVATAFVNSELSLRGLAMVCVGYKEPTPYAQRLLALDGVDGVRVLKATYAPDVLVTLRSNCHCYVHGNCVGGTNPALLEAMATCPRVIAVNNEFNQEVLGRDGVYFERGNIEPGLHAAAALGVQSEALRLRAHRLYQWDAVAESYMRLGEGRPAAYAPATYPPR